MRVQAVFQNLLLAQILGHWNSAIGHTQVTQTAKIDTLQVVVSIPDIKYVKWPKHPKMATKPWNLFPIALPCWGEVKLGGESGIMQRMPGRKGVISRQV